MKMKMMLVVAAALLTTVAYGETWIAGPEWDASNNPSASGIWSYHNMDGSLLTNVAVNLFGWGADAWVNDSANPGNPPIMFGDTAHYVFDGWNTFEMHGPGFIRWTSPGEFLITLNPGSGGFQTGYMGFPNDPPDDIRDVYWSILHNGVALNTAQLPKWDLSGGEWPPQWALMVDGDGGLASVTDIHVYPGDTIDMSTWGNPFATFSVFYLQLDGTPIPEPITMSLLGLGGLFVLGRRKKC